MPKPPASPCHGPDRQGLAASIPCLSGGAVPKEGRYAQDLHPPERELVYTTQFVNASYPSTPQQHVGASQGSVEPLPLHM